MSYSVFFRDAHVGTLSSDRARLSFTYLRQTAAAGQPALSVRLPVRTTSYPHENANPFFANLLPEEEYRHLLARIIGLSARNVAGLLGAIGGECAGAVSIWPEGQHPVYPPEYVALSDAEVSQLFEASDDAQRLRVVREGRLSLAGAMEKVGLRRAGDCWHRGQAGAPTTHILKWAPASLPDLNYNELFCMALLRDAGLPVVDAYIDGKSPPVLIVPRFDRIEQSDGRILLLHQEDFCQATGTDPAQKYEAEGGPGLATCAEVLRRHAGVPAREIALLVRWTVGNFIIGNCDAHGKNLALLYTPDGLRLAPFYDLASTSVYRGLSRKLAMAIGGEYRQGYIRLRHWEQFATSIAVPFRAVRSDALKLADAIEESLPGVTARLTSHYGGVPIITDIAHLVAKQIARVRAALGTPLA